MNICPNPNCAHCGPASLRTESPSLLTFFLLSALGWIPGVVYLLMKPERHFIHCTRCGGFIREAAPWS